jgi:hypothetical protein
LRTGEPGGAVGPGDPDYERLEALSGVERMLIPRPDLPYLRPQTLQRAVVTKMGLGERDEEIVKWLREAESNGRESD